MVNYVLSFCKITGASKIFKRNFYLPLLKPLTPREALRTLRITGKWLLGAKRQHYIPVLLHHTEKRPENGKIVHSQMEDYTYVTPTLDPENESHKLLLEILEKNECDENFVYTIDDKKYSIVFSKQFEVALRNGEIIDVLVSQKNDRIVLKLKNRKKVPMELQYYEDEDKELYCGEAATDEEQEKFHHHGKYTMGLAKIFEDKEMREEKWEEELKKMMKRRKKQRWENSKAYKEMMRRNLKNLDWDRFETEAKKVIEEISEPVEEKAIEMEVDDLDATRNVNDTILSRGPEMLNQLPTLNDIPELIKSLGNASLHAIEDEHPANDHDKRRRVSGVKVTLPSGKECFVSGQMVLTEEGEVFVPGQTIHNEFGDEYVPGITANIDNQPTLVGGLILGEEAKEPMFVASQATITNDGTLTFTANPEERPPPPPEAERKVKRKKPQEEPVIVKPQEDPVIVAPEEQAEKPIQIILVEDSSEESESEEVSTETNTTESLNNSELEELDMEAIALRQERHRQEMEALKQQLFDDMGNILSNLDEKKKLLNEKLEELRRQHLDNSNSLVTYIGEKDALEVASKINQDSDVANRLTDILLTLIRKSSAFRDKNNIRVENIDYKAEDTDTEDRFEAKSNKLKTLYKTALVAANDVFKNRPKDQLLALTTVGNILAGPLKNDSKLLAEFLDAMKTQYDRDEICKAALKQLTQVIVETKMSMMRKLLDVDMALQEFLETVGKILGDDNIMNIAFAKMMKINKNMTGLLKEHFEDRLDKAMCEKEAIRALQKAIVASTKDVMESNYKKLQNNERFDEVKEDAIAFAAALELEEVGEELKELSQHNYGDQTVDLLKRTTLIRQLAERDYSLKTAIQRLKKNPECAKSDPRIRQLIRESATLISDFYTVYNSKCIPLQMLQKQNLLAVEDYLVRKSNLDFPVLISRGTLQAVIPKDASRGVLSGRVPYVLLDESGATNFKPMHMMAAVQVNKNRERRIDDYLGGGAKRERSLDGDGGDTSMYLKAKTNLQDRRTSGSDQRRALGQGALPPGGGRGSDHVQTGTHVRRTEAQEGDYPSPGGLRMRRRPRAAVGDEAPQEGGPGLQEEVHQSGADRKGDIRYRAKQKDDGLEGPDDGLRAARLT